MKKLIWVIFISLCLSSSAYAKIDESYVKQIYEGCISDAKQNNDYNSDSKKFCKCYANEFNKKFNNDQLIEFLSKSDQEKAQIIQNEISPPCYPTTNKNSEIITFKRCFALDSFENFEEAMEVEEVSERYYEINLNKKTASSIWVYKGATYIDSFQISAVTSKLVVTHLITIDTGSTGKIHRHLILDLKNKKVEQFNKYLKYKKTMGSDTPSILQCQ